MKGKQKIERMHSPLDFMDSSKKITVKKGKIREITGAMLKTTTSLHTNAPQMKPAAEL